MGKKKVSIGVRLQDGYYLQGVTSEVTPQEYEDIETIVTKAIQGDVKFMTLYTSVGKLFIPPQVLKNSIITLKNEKDE